MKRKIVVGTIALTIFASFVCFASYTRTAGWNWINGYCYYYTDIEHQNLLKSCTTPDGYTVDDQGRWTENGVPQHNGYGTKVMGTDQLYEGLDDTSRVNVMKNELQNVYHNLGYEFLNGNDQIYNNLSCMFTKENNSWHYATLWFTDNVWNDSPECSVSNRSEFYEQAIKLLVGDHVGQELFDQIRAAAEPNVAGGSVVYRDENGNIEEYIDEEGFHCVRLVQTATKGNGVDFSLINWQAWNGRKTDYGKTIEFDFRGEDTAHPDEWIIIVK